MNGRDYTGIEQRFKIGGNNKPIIGTIPAGGNTKVTSRLFGAVYKKSSKTVSANWPVIAGFFFKSNPYYAPESQLMIF